MNPEELKEKIKDVFVQYFELDREELKDEKQLFTDLGLDSLDIVDLIVGLQKEFKLDLRQYAGLREIRSFGDVCRVMEDLCRQNQR
ncbi:MAG: hypothetical protein A2X49_16505 [Lentisphaerae bacterium GWF2_52_8]|nr:MAG: hypothetical protein A2X49_16505 [Lentisphaerae bacterium GWF2_52_8]